MAVATSSSWLLIVCLPLLCPIPGDAQWAASPIRGIAAGDVVHNDVTELLMDHCVATCMTGCLETCTDTYVRDCTCADGMGDCFPACSATRIREFHGSPWSLKECTPKCFDSANSTAITSMDFNWKGDTNRTDKDSILTYDSMGRSGIVNPGPKMSCGQKHNTAASIAYCKKVNGSLIRSATCRGAMCYADLSREPNCCRTTQMKCGEGFKPNTTCHSSSFFDPGRSCEGSLCVYEDLARCCARAMTCEEGVDRKIYKCNDEHQVANPEGFCAGTYCLASEAAACCVQRMMCLLGASIPKDLSLLQTDQYPPLIDQTACDPLTEIFLLDSYCAGPECETSVDRANCCGTRQSCGAGAKALYRMGYNWQANPRLCPTNMKFSANSLCASDHCSNEDSRDCCVDDPDKNCKCFLRLLLLGFICRIFNSVFCPIQSEQFTSYNYLFDQTWK